MLNPKLRAEDYPINRVIIFYDALDHSNFLGLQWELVCKSKFPVGYNPNDSDYNQIGKTGGEKTHTLTIDEIPPHSHNSYYSVSVLDGGTWWSQANSGNTVSTSKTGGGKPHENRPPYEVMAFWRRIA